MRRGSRNAHRGMRKCIEGLRRSIYNFWMKGQLRAAGPGEVGLACAKCKSARNIGEPDLMVGFCSNCDAETLFFSCPNDGTKVSAAIPEKNFKKFANQEWTCPDCNSTHKLGDVRSPFGAMRPAEQVRAVQAANGGKSPAGSLKLSQEDYLNQLHGRLAEGIRGALYEDEKIELMYSSSGLSIKNTQALILTNRRVLIGKSGRDAGMHFGKEVTAFNYAEITNVEYRTGPLTGWIEILSPAFPAILNPHFYSSGEANDPWKRPNCIPVILGDKKKGNEIALEIRRRTDAAKNKQGTPIVQSGTDLADQIQKLADLLPKGLITEHEFRAAKAKLIN